MPVGSAVAVVLLSASRPGGAPREADEAAAQSATKGPLPSTLRLDSSVKVEPESAV